MAIDTAKLRQAFALAREAAPDCYVQVNVHARSQDDFNAVAKETGAKVLLVTPDGSDTEWDSVSLGGDLSSTLGVLGPERERARGAA